MQRFQTFCYALIPTGAQARRMRRFAGACRFVFNRALALQQTRHQQGESRLDYTALCRQLTAWRHDPALDWLMQAPTHPLQQALKDLERAYANFFAGRAGFPRFKRKGMHASIRYPDPKQIKLDQGNGRIFLPKLGWLRYRASRPVPGQVKNVTVSLSAGRWFIAVQTERELEQPVLAATMAIGVDVGIVRFATFSDGAFIAPINSFKLHQQRLARYQRSMSRKIKFSSNWKKAQAKVQRLHALIANVRRDFLHKTTAAISRQYTLVCIEDLRVRDMSASAAGTVQAPGRNVRAKSGLNQAILDQGWGEFRRQLEYKLAWRGGMLLAVPPHYTSQTCPSCGHVSGHNRRTQGRFTCVACGYENNADVVGAMNILERGHRLSACGETAQSGRSMKQEPTEATGRRPSGAAEVLFL